MTLSPQISVEEQTEREPMAWVLYDSNLHALQVLFGVGEETIDRFPNYCLGARRGKDLVAKGLLWALAYTFEREFLRGFLLAVRFRSCCQLFFTSWNA